MDSYGWNYLGPFTRMGLNLMRRVGCEDVCRVMVLFIYEWVGISKVATESSNSNVNVSNKMYYCHASFFAAARPHGRESCVRLRLFGCSASHFNGIGK